MRALVFFAAAAAVVGLLFACSHETIVLATVPDDNEQDGASQPIKCAKKEDCPSDTFCDKSRCDSAAGTCTHPPLVCPDTEAPSCGCDGVNYFNDCLRQAAGVSGSDNGECLHRGASCDTQGHGCLAGQSCAQLSGFGDPTSCISPGGRCWVLPSTCPPSMGDDRWDECSTAPDALHCQDTCNAIRSGRSFVRAATCP